MVTIQRYIDKTNRNGRKHKKRHNNNNNTDNEKKRKKKKHSSKKRFLSADEEIRLARLDHETACQEPSLFTDEVKKLILYGTSTGHAQQGHCAFKCFPRPNMTIERFIELVHDESFVPQIKIERQIWIDHLEKHRRKVAIFMEALDRGTKSEVEFYDIFSNDFKGKKLCGYDFQYHLTDFRFLGIGDLLGANLDSENSRRLLQERMKDTLKINKNKSNTSPFKRLESIVKRSINRGTSLALRKNYFEETSIDYINFTDSKSKARAEYLIRKGVVDNKGHADQSLFVETLLTEGIAIKDTVEDMHNEFVNVYIGITRGLGMSDDAAYITAGLMFGNNFLESKDVRKGFLDIDWVDTVDKCASKIIEGGQDEKLGKILNKAYKKRCKTDLVDMDRILAWMYMSLRINEKAFPSSSQRYFMKVHTDDFSPERVPLSTIQIYDMFVDNALGGSLDRMYYPNIIIDFERIPFKTFAKGYIQRWNEVREECEVLGLFPKEYFPDHFKNC